VQEAKGIELPTSLVNSCDLQLAVDAVPANVVSAVQYLAGTPWNPYSKVPSRLSTEAFKAESETSFSRGIKNVDIDIEEDIVVKNDYVPYDRRVLRLPTNSTVDVLDGAAESFPAILEATSILDSSTPAALKGKAGRQGMLTLQKTLAVLASRQLALPLGRLKIYEC
jgi:hypothetical protein